MWGKAREVQRSARALGYNQGRDLEGFVVTRRAAAKGRSVGQGLMAIGAWSLVWGAGIPSGAVAPVRDPVVQLRTVKHCQGCDLRYRDLTSLDLQDADLRSANLYGANLSGVNLQRANLQDANLGAADCARADLRGANLHRANLRSANLRAALLDRVDLTRSNLMFTDLRGASLANANLRDANLLNIRSEGAELCGVILPNGTPIRQNCYEPKPEPAKI